MTKYKFQQRLAQKSVVWQHTKTFRTVFLKGNTSRNEYVSAPMKKFKKTANAMIKILQRHVAQLIKTAKRCNFFMAYLPYRRR